MKITFRHTSQIVIDPISTKKMREVSAEVFDESVYASAKPIAVVTVSSETATVADAMEAVLGKIRRLQREVVKEAARCGWVSLRDHATYTEAEVVQAIRNARERMFEVMPMKQLDDLIELTAQELRQ